MKAAASGVLLGLVALAACRNPHSEAQRIAASAHAKASAAAAARSAEKAEAARAASARLAVVPSASVRLVEPIPPEPADPGAVLAWIAPGTSSAEIDAQIWAILEGKTPSGGIPTESYNPELSEAPEDTKILRGSGQGSGGSSRPPQVRVQGLSVTGALPPEVIQRIVRQHFGRFRLCYENGLRQRPTLRGNISIRFVIDPRGAVSRPEKKSSDLPDPGVVSCVVRAVSDLSFPAPESGTVAVILPIQFSPPGGP